MCFEARLYNKTNKVFYIENVSRINIGGGKKILCTKFTYKLFFYQYCQELYTHATKLRVGAYIPRKFSKAHGAGTGGNILSNILKCDLT